MSFMNAKFKTKRFSSPLYMIQVYYDVKSDLKWRIIPTILLCTCHVCLAPLIWYQSAPDATSLSAALSCYCAVHKSARSQHFTFKGRGSSSWLNWCSNTTAASTFADRGSFLTKSSKCSSVSNPRTEGKAQEEHDIIRGIHLTNICFIRFHWDYHPDLRNSSPSLWKENNRGNNARSNYRKGRRMNMFFGSFSF